MDDRLRRCRQVLAWNFFPLCSENRANCCLDLAARRDGGHHHVAIPIEFIEHRALLPPLSWPPWRWPEAPIKCRWRSFASPGCRVVTPSGPKNLNICSPGLERPIDDAPAEGFDVVEMPGVGILRICPTGIPRLMLVDPFVALGSFRTAVFWVSTRCCCASATARSR